MRKENMANINELRREYGNLRTEAIRWGDTQEDFDAYAITQVMERAQVQATGPNDYVEFAGYRLKRFRGERCCPKAKWIDCVCSVAFKCPEHGQRHIGTHD
jgi:hypothetical protein